MEQYLGQFVGNLVASFQGEPLSNTLFSGFMLLAGFTFLAYLVFRIALLALKVGAVVAFLAIVASMGMPGGELLAKQQTNSDTQTDKQTQYSLPDVSKYVSEERLREIFLGYIKGLHR